MTQCCLSLTHLGIKWLTFCKQHFQMYFLVRKILYFDSNFPWGLIDNKSASVQILAVNSWQVITWTSDGPFHWCIYAQQSWMRTNLAWLFPKGLLLMMKKKAMQYEIWISKHNIWIICHYVEVTNTIMTMCIVKLMYIYLFPGFLFHFNEWRR